MSGRDANQPPSDRDIRTAALRRTDTFSVMDVVNDLGHNRLSLGTHAWHVIRDLVDEGLVARSREGYTVIAMPEQDPNQLAADVEAWVRSRVEPLATPASRTAATEKGRAALAELVARITDLERALENGDRLLSQAGRQCHERYGLAEARITDLEAQVAALTRSEGIFAGAMERAKERAEAAEAALATTRQALTEIAAGLGYPTLYREVARRALAATDSDSPPVSPFHTEPVPS